MYKDNNQRWGCIRNGGSMSIKLTLILFLLCTPAWAITSTVDSRAISTIQYATPATGDTITVGSTGSTKLLINPSGSLLTLTISFPSVPTDGDYLQIGSSQAVTTVTMSNGTVVGPLTTMAVGTFASYIYNSTASKWFRVG